MRARSRRCRAGLSAARPTSIHASSWAPASTKPGMSVATASSVAAERTLADRVLAAIPLLSIFLWLCIVYAIEAWAHGTPWLFGDELELTQLSRAIADTGHAARRGEPHSFHSLYVVLTSPIWLIHDVATAYAGVKYLDVFVMASVMFPTYLLARMVVAKP